MTESSSGPPRHGQPGDSTPRSDPSVEELRSILFDRYRLRIAELEAETYQELKRTATTSYEAAMKNRITMRRNW